MPDLPTTPPPWWSPFFETPDDDAALEIAAAAEDPEAPAKATNPAATPRQSRRDAPQRPPAAEG